MGQQNRARLWEAWRAAGVHGRIASSVIAVAMATAVVKLGGLAKVMVVARRFGAGDELDAFLIAFLVPSFIAEFVAGSVAAALIPAFVEQSERAGAAAARRLLAEAAAAVLLLLLLLTALIGFFTNAVVATLASGFGPAKAALAVSLLRLMLPIALFSGLASVSRAVLTALGRFALAASVPAITPLAIIASLFLAPASWRVAALALGTLCGSALELLIAVVALRSLDFLVLPRWRGLNPALVQVLRQYAPMVGAFTLLAASGLVDQTMAASLGSGSVSILSYGVRLNTFILAMGPAVVATAVFPHFSRLVAREDWIELRRSLRLLLPALFLASLPLTLLLAAFSAPLVRLLLQQGAFSQADTHMVAAVQRLALLQLPFAFLAVPAARLVSALKANAVLFRAALLHLLANVLFDLLFIRWLGVAGIGLASACVLAVDCCYLLFALSSRLNPDRPTVVFLTSPALPRPAPDQGAW